MFYMAGMARFDLVGHGVFGRILVLQGRCNKDESR